jgi:nucleoside-diphosphate-sugar epimerase
VTIVRPFNTYGPRQSARAVIPTIITQLLAGKDTIKLGALDTTRDLVYVKDTVDGFIAVAKSGRTVGEEINIATEREISIGDLAGRIIGIINPKAKIVTEKERVRPSKSEVEHLLGANKKIKKLTGWKPGYSLDKGLKGTIEWFSRAENRKNYKADIYNV